MSGRIGSGNFHLIVKLLALFYDGLSLLLSSVCGHFLFPSFEEYFSSVLQLPNPVPGQQQSILSSLPDAALVREGEVTHEHGIGEDDVAESRHR